MPDISIGRLRGGFCVYWREDGRKRRHQLKACTREDADAEAVAVYKRETMRSSFRGETIASIWEEYRKDLGEKPAAKTLMYMGKSILPHFGSYVAQEIDKELCVAYDEEREAAGKTQGTIHTELGHLRMALNWSVKAKLLDRAPHIWRPAKPESDKRILDRAEMRALVKAADAPHIRLALVLLLGTGARVGALLDLTWDRVDFERGSINLRLSDTVTRKGQAVVPMRGMTRAALATAFEAALSDDVIEYAAGPLKRIRKGVMGAVERSGIGHVRIHDPRHTAAVTMLSKGVDLTMVAQCLGHSNTAITYKTYARYLPQHTQEAVDVLDFMTPKKRVG